MLTREEMLREVANSVRKRHERYEHIAVDEFPALSTLNEIVYMGSFSWTLTTSRKRLIARSGRREIDGMLCSAGDLARDYIAIKYPEKLRATGDQANEILRKRSHPLYARIGEYDYCYYVDLKSAYWSILKTVGWDCDYFPRKWLGLGQLMADFPFPDDKLTRNCLVTAGLVTPRRIWDGRFKSFRARNEGNPRPNYGLWAIVQDILHSIAYEVIINGGVYVHTDGYIVPAANLGSVAGVIESWGLQATIKREGKAKVLGAGGYTFSGATDREHIRAKTDFNNVRRVDYLQWLKRRISRAANMRLS